MDTPRDIIFKHTSPCRCVSDESEKCTCDPTIKVHVPGIGRVDAQRPIVYIMQEMEKLLRGYMTEKELRGDSYPDFNIDGDKDPKIWLLYHGVRPIFRVKDDYFFRRHEGRWSDHVVKGKNCDGRINWMDGATTEKELREVLWYLKDLETHKESEEVK